MSRQLTFSATVSTLVLALFAMTAGSGPAVDGAGAVPQPAIGAAFN